jgi:hypothetical protein
MKDVTVGRGGRNKKWLQKFDEIPWKATFEKTGNEMDISDTVNRLIGPIHRLISQ